MESSVRLAHKDLRRMPGVDDWNQLVDNGSVKAALSQHKCIDAAPLIPEALNKAGMDANKTPTHSMTYEVYHMNTQTLDIMYTHSDLDNLCLIDFNLLV